MGETTTVRVRVAVAVDAEGRWRAFGNNFAHDTAKEAILKDEWRWPGSELAIHWLTADLPLPTEPEVAARVEGERGE